MNWVVEDVMKRLRRALLVLLSMIGVLTLAGIVVYFTFRVPLARYVIERQLRRAGVVDASFHVRRVSLNQIELQSVEIKQPQWGYAATVQASYSLSSLIRGRVRSMSIHNARINWDGFARGSTGQSEFAVPEDASFDLLSLRDAVMIVAGEHGSKHVTINGSLRRAGSRTFHLDATVLGGDEFTYQLGDATLTGLVVNAHFSIRTGSRETVITSRDNTIIGVERLALTNSGVESTPIRLHLEANAGEPVARISSGHNRLLFSAAAEFKSPAAITVKSDTWHAFVPSFSVSARVEKTVKGEWTSRMDVGVQGASLRSQAFGGIAVAGLSSVIPIDFNVPVARRGPINADALVWRGAQFEQFTGSLGMAEWLLDADIEGSLGSGARIAVNAGFDFTNGLAGDMAVFIPPFQLTDAENLRRIVPQLREAQLGGTFEMTAQALYRQGEFNPYVHVKAANAKIYNTQWPLAIDSADADIVFTSLAPLRTPPQQRVTIRQARVGKLEVDGGEVAFQVQDMSGTSIEAIRWSMGEYGQFQASPFSMHLLKPQFDSTVTATNVGLGAWLDLLSDGRSTSDGVLGGTMTVRVDAALRQPVRVLGGHLEGTPSQGNIAVEDARMLSQFLDRSAAQALDQEQWEALRTRLVEALADYRYSLFQVDFLPEEDDVLCRIQTSGRGRTGPDSQEIALLTINVRNFNDVLNNVMLFHAAFSGRE